MVGSTWTSLEFTPDGSELLLTTNGGRAYLIDSFEGDVVHTFNTASGVNAAAAGVGGGSGGGEKALMADGSMGSFYSCVQGSISPDSGYIALGSLEDGSINIWKRKTGEFLKQSEGHLSNPCCLVKFNPVYFMMASTCSHLVSV